MVLSFVQYCEQRRASTLRGQPGCIHFPTRIVILAGIEVFKYGGKKKHHFCDEDVLLYFCRDLNLQEREIISGAQRSTAGE